MWVLRLAVMCNGFQRNKKRKSGNSLFVYRSDASSFLSCNYVQDKLGGEKKKKRLSDLLRLPHSVSRGRIMLMVYKTMCSIFARKAWRRLGVWTMRIGLARKAFTREWAAEFIKGGINGETFFNSSFGSGEVALSQGNTSIKSAKTQESESAWTTAWTTAWCGSYTVECGTRWTGPHIASTGYFTLPVSRLFLHSTDCYEYGQKCAHQCFTITCILSKQYYLETGIVVDEPWSGRVRKQRGEMCVPRWRSRLPSKAKCICASSLGWGGVGWTGEEGGHGGWHSAITVKKVRRSCCCRGAAGWGTSRHGTPAAGWGPEPTCAQGTGRRPWGRRSPAGSSRSALARWAAAAWRGGPPGSASGSPAAGSESGRCSRGSGGAGSSTGRRWGACWRTGAERRGQDKNTVFNSALLTRQFDTWGAGGKKVFLLKYWFSLKE